MSKKEKELIVREETALVIPGAQATIELPEDFLSDDDIITQEEEPQKYPYLSIRQKDPREETGIIWKKGWWKVANAPETDDIEPPLKVVILFWARSRRYFRDGDDSPYCKSIDGRLGTLITDETAHGHCSECQYNQWENGNRPPCAEGRSLYCFHQDLGPVIVQFGRSGIKPWQAFDNIMAVKKVKGPGGKIIRIPWHLNIIELHTKKVTKKSYDPYWEPEIRHIGIIQDKPTLDVLRNLLKAKAEYDEVAKHTDFEAEDANGSTFTDAQSDKQWAEKELDKAIKANNPKTNPDGSVADDDAFNTLI